MNKWIIWALALTFFLNSCGQSAKGDDGKVTLKFLSVFSTQDPEGDIERTILEGYKKENPNVSIDTIGVSMNSLSTQVITLATGKNLPDLIFANMDMAPQFDDIGVIDDGLEELLGTDFLSNFNRAALDVATRDNKLLYLPLYINPIAVVYRKDLFEEKQLSPPITAEELLDVARQLTEDTDGDGNIDRWGMAFIATKNSSGAYRALPVMQEFGAYPLVEKNGEWTTKFGGPESEKALQFIYDLIVRDKSTPPGALETGHPEAINLMVSDKAAMMFTGSSSYGALLDQAPELRDKLSSFPWPHENGFSAVELGATGYTITSSSEHKETAANFLQYYENYNNMLYFAKNTGRMPTRNDVNKSDYFANPLFTGFVETLNYTVNPPLFSGKNEMRDVMMDAVHAVVGSNQPISEVNKAMGVKAQEVLQNY